MKAQYPFISSGKFHNAEAYINQTLNKNVQMIAGIELSILQGKRY